MIDNIKQANIKFQKEVVESPELKNKLNDLSKGQKPHTIVITCSDSRVIPEYIFKANFGELFVIRTAGNVLNIGELGTIEYGISHLKIKDIVVMGHTSCGAIHASIKNEKGTYVDAIINIIKENIKGIIDENDASIENAKKVAKEIKEKFSQFDLNVLSCLYDIKTGIVSWN